MYVLYVCMYVRTYVRTYVCTYVCTYTYGYTYVYTYVCMYVCMYVLLHVKFYSQRVAHAGQEPQNRPLRNLITGIFPADILMVINPYVVHFVQVKVPVK